MNNITSAPNVINCGNTSMANFKIRESMKDNKETPSEIFAKLNKRGKLNPKQNAMNYQLTNDQLYRFYTEDVEPKLRQSNETMSGDPNDVLKKEIQRLLTVGDTKNTDLVKLLQGNFSSLSASVAAAGTAPIAPLAPPTPPPIAPLAPPTPPPIAPLAPPTPPIAPIATPPTPPIAPIATPPTPPIAPIATPPTPPIAPITTPPTPPIAPIVPLGGGGTPPPIAPSLAAVAAGITAAAAAGTAGTAGSGLPTPATPATPTPATPATPASPTGGGTLDMLWKNKTVSMPINYIDVNTDTIKKAKKDWPVLVNNVDAKKRWNKIIPELATAPTYKSIQATVASFKASFGTPKDFYEAYKRAEPTYDISQLFAPSPTPSPAGVLSAAPTAPPAGAAGAAGGTGAAGGVLAAGVGGGKTLVYPETP
jgi:hypothetical protein